MALDLDSVSDDQESIVVTGKGNVVRDVPLALGVRKALRAWLEVRGMEAGPLLTPMSKTKPRVPLVVQRLSTGAVRNAVGQRFGLGVTPHDLRRTFTGNLLDTGADLSLVAKVLGHASTETTAGYDRRSFAARQAAVQKLDVPVADHV